MKKKSKEVTLILVMFALMVTLLPNVSLGSDTQAAAEGPQKEFTESLLEAVQEQTYWVQSYEFQRWDCTNQSAVLYTMFSTCGIDTKIVTGRFGSSRNWHAMLEVVLDGKEYRIEPNYLTFYEDGELEKMCWNEWSKYTLEEAKDIWSWEFSVPNDIGSILFDKKK